MLNREYWHLGYALAMSKENVRDADRETQKEAMRGWFFEHYEDPAGRTPYDPSEGGYNYICGGPYDATKELSDEFGDIVPGGVIEELAEELGTYSSEWAGKAPANDFDDYYSYVGDPSTKFYETFTKSYDNINLLLETEVNPTVHQHFLRLLYVNIITTLETFLSDAFINTVLNDEKLFRKFVETNTDFKQRKLSLNQIYSMIENIKNDSRKYLIDLNWHNLEKIKPMYKKTLDIDFPEDLSEIFKSIIIRHDIVHRNGKTKDGIEIELQKEVLVHLLGEVWFFVNYLDNQFDKGESNNSLE